MYMENGIWMNEWMKVDTRNDFNLIAFKYIFGGLIRGIVIYTYSCDGSCIGWEEAESVSISINTQRSEELHQGNAIGVKFKWSILKNINESKFQGSILKKWSKILMMNEWFH